MQPNGDGVISVIEFEQLHKLRLGLCLGPLDHEENAADENVNIEVSNSDHGVAGGRETGEIRTDDDVQLTATPIINRRQKNETRGLKSGLGGEYDGNHSLGDGDGNSDGDGDGDGDICEMDQEHSVRGIRNSGGNDDDADDDDDAPLLTFRQRQDAQVLIWYMVLI